VSICERCGGLGWVPVGAEGQWYAGDWRKLLEPGTAWEHCPVCGDQRSPMTRLHEGLAALALQRLDEEVRTWRFHGAWRQGQTVEHQVIYRWRDMAYLPPGPMVGADGWTLISRLGVQRSLTRAQGDELLDKLGAPELA